jgi:hypothetical protein
MTPEQQAIIDILEDSKWVAYEKRTNGWWSSKPSYSAVQVLSPTAIDRIKDLFAKNEKSI